MSQRISLQVPSSLPLRRHSRPPERELARHVQLILPAGADVAKLLVVVKRWPAVEDARLPPQVSLP
jgi:hypothetical protein